MGSVSSAPYEFGVYIRAPDFGKLLDCGCRRINIDATIVSNASNIPQHDMGKMPGS